jgi:preprotein translocase subunit SecD
VVMFMFVYYRLFGLFANVALVLNMVFLAALLSLMGATLTLPGIAGMLLTLGMAVDANVLINERIREELRAGTAIQSAIYSGYSKAFVTIVDANLTTLIVGVVLYGMGSGPVKGFAVTLTLGLLTSMLTSVTYTRALVNLTYGRRTALKKLSIGI